MAPKAFFGAALLIGLAAPIAVAQEASFAVVGPIIAERCAVCHSATPTQTGYITPPNGVTFDTPDEIADKADRIKLWAITTEIMPLNNATEMTDDERALLAAWLEAGADISN